MSSSAVGSYDVFEKHTLSDGTIVWIQRVKVPGVRKPTWNVVQCSPDAMGDPWCDITDAVSKDDAYGKLAEILKGDVLEL